MSKHFTMKKQQPSFHQYKGELFYDMPAPLPKYRRHDKKRMEMFDIPIDKELRSLDAKYWKFVRSR